MTNQEQHIGDTEICEVCKSGVESILHVLRDCQAIADIWQRILPRGRPQVFFAMTCLDWLFVNLSENPMTENGPWSTVFAVAVWSGVSASNSVGPASRQECLISWTPPLWCGGFSLNIGRCTAPLAELWGVYYGLCIVWEKKVQRLINGGWVLNDRDLSSTSVVFPGLHTFDSVPVDLLPVLRDDECGVMQQVRV
ncbi:unnamed protein product [Microthlaspi erraticum]|uniref:Reverse transcriptase zinc-binding domain-containing protein n=1 Tax=Microthlaspi erraticum TaxID=1685480 RepID=A0A6D2JQJ1_9BRAS|nr:unnamed protein product [Microthlaspi erraticum]